MSPAMNDLQFAGFIMHLKSQQQGIPIKAAASLIGKQPTLVLGKELQVSNRLCHVLLPECDLMYCRIC